VIATDHAGDQTHLLQRDRAVVRDMNEPGRNREGAQDQDQRGKLLTEDDRRGEQPDEQINRPQPVSGDTEQGADQRHHHHPVAVEEIVEARIDIHKIGEAVNVVEQRRSVSEAQPCQIDRGDRSDDQQPVPDHRGLGLPPARGIQKHPAQSRPLHLGHERRGSEKQQIDQKQSGERACGVPVAGRFDHVGAALDRGARHELGHPQRKQRHEEQKVAGEVLSKPTQKEQKISSAA